MKNRTWALIFMALIAGLLLVWYLVPGGSGKTAGIYQDGELLQTIVLPYTGETKTFQIDGPAGGNTVEVSQDGIRVIDAGCPDRLCVAHGFLTPGEGPIICLPNKLVIRLTDDARTDGADAVAGGRSVP